MNVSNFARLRILGAVAALGVAIAVIGVVARSDTAYAQVFNPCGLLAISDSSPGANANIESTFGVGIGADCRAIPPEPSDTPDLQFAATINFTPPEWGVYRDADVPDGAIVADLSSIAQLGLLGGACKNRLFPQFDMMDATTDMSVQVPFQDPEEEFDPADKNDIQGDEPDDQFDIPADFGKPGNVPLGVTRYPDYLARIFKDADDNTLTPIARLYGQTEVAGIEVSLNFVLFEPGTVFKTRAGEIRRTDPRLGYPSATVLQAVGDPDTEADVEDNQAVNDFCSPLQADTTIFATSQDNPDTAANESGTPVRTNPTDGTYNFVTYAVSQYDADGDGIENSLDPCPTDPNPNWDPRVGTLDPLYSGDQDGDHLPDECDPDPAVKGPVDPSGNYDQDLDRYWNRGDNCPLVANSSGQLGGTGADNQEDLDLDGIGDACDPNPGVADGQRFEVCLVSQITVGAGGPAPDPAPQNMRPCDPNAVLVESTYPGDACSDGLDNDADGSTDSADSDCADADGGDGDGGTATPAPGATPTPAPTGGNGVGGDPGTGVGSLAPVASSIPAWATIVSALGGAGLLGSLGALAARIFGIRLPGRRD